MIKFVEKKKKIVCTNFVFYRLNVAQQLQMLKMDLLYREHFRDYDYNFQIYFALEKILKDYLHNILSQDGKVAVKQITELLPG